MPSPEDYQLVGGLSSPGDDQSESYFTKVMKSLLRLNTSVSPEVRKRQVSQYLGDDPNALPDAKDRPTALSKFQDQPFKSVKEYYPRLIQMPKDVVGKNVNELKLPYKFDEHNQPTVALGSKYGGINGMIGQNSLGNYMGLGRATTSIGKDERGKPYLSTFDSWDFDNPDDMTERLLKKLGHPYNVYDRIPIQSNTIPEYVDPFTRGDIELPDPRRR